MGDEEAPKLREAALEPEERKLTPLININRFYNIIKNDVNEFIEKFTKFKYISEEIKACFPNKYKDLSKVVDLKNVDIIPEYRSYNYKIKLIAGKELLYSKIRPISP